MTMNPALVSNNKVRLSILMPVFNEADYIRLAVESVLNYCYPDWLIVSVVIVNDFSTDSTENIARELQSRWSGAVFFCENKRKGKNAAFNLAFTFVECGYICLLGGDDLIVPQVLINRVSALERVLINDPGRAGSVASACKIKTFSLEPAHSDIVIPRSPELGSLSGGSIMFNIQLAKRIFPLPENLPNEDTWIGLCLKYWAIDIVHVPEIGLNYRIHAGNSHKRGVPFSEFRLNMWKRSKALLGFYVCYGDDLSVENERDLVGSIFIECAKMMSASLSICFARHIGFRSKVVALTYSSNWFYWIKQRFFKLLTGR